MKVYWERDDESTQLKDHCEVFLQGGIRERVNLGRYFCNNFFLSYLLCVFAGRYKKWGEKLVAGLCSLFFFFFKLRLTQFLKGSTLTKHWFIQISVVQSKLINDHTPNHHLNMLVAPSFYYPFFYYYAHIYYFFSQQ
jgi:hypothetical protein